MFPALLPSQWDEKAVDVFLPRICNQASRLDQHFVCFLRYLDHPWSKLGRNQVLGKNGGSGFRCFCQDQYFQACSFINSLIYPGTFMRKGRLSLSCWCKLAIYGVERKDQGPEKPQKRACPLCTFCVLSSSHIEWPASALCSYKNRHMKQFKRRRGPRDENEIKISFYTTSHWLKHLKNKLWSSTVVRMKFQTVNGSTAFWRKFSNIWWTWESTYPITLDV